MTGKVLPFQCFVTARRGMSSWQLRVVTSPGGLPWLLSVPGARSPLESLIAAGTGFVGTKVWKLLPWCALMVRVCKCCYWVSPGYRVVFASLLCGQADHERPWGFEHVCRIWNCPSMNQFLCVHFVLHCFSSREIIFFQMRSRNEKKCLKLHHCWKATTGQDKQLALSTLCWVPFSDN